MKVWAVDGEINGDSTRYLMGIYSTIEKAEEAMVEGRSRDDPIFDPYVREWEIDVPLEGFQEQL